MERGCNGCIITCYNCRVAVVCFPVNGLETVVWLWCRFVYRLEGVLEVLYDYHCLVSIYPARSTVIYIHTC